MHARNSTISCSLLTSIVVSSAYYRLLIFFPPIGTHLLPVFDNINIYKYELPHSTICQYGKISLLNTCTQLRWKTLVKKNGEELKIVSKNVLAVKERFALSVRNKL